MGRKGRVSPHRYGVVHKTPPARVRSHLPFPLEATDLACLRGGLPGDPAIDGSGHQSTGAGAVPFSPRNRAIVMDQGVPLVGADTPRDAHPRRVPPRQGRPPRTYVRDEYFPCGGAQQSGLLPTIGFGERWPRSRVARDFVLLRALGRADWRPRTRLFGDAALGHLIGFLTATLFLLAATLRSERVLQTLTLGQTAGENRPR